MFERLHHSRKMVMLYGTSIVVLRSKKLLHYHSSKGMQQHPPPTNVKEPGGETEAKKEKETKCSGAV